METPDWLDWEKIQKEIDEATDQPKIEQLDKITILRILEMLPAEETWLICLGRFRVQWKNRNSFKSWWSKDSLWWMKKIDEHNSLSD